MRARWRRRRSERISWWYPGDPLTGFLAACVVVGLVVLVVVVIVHG